MNTDDENGRPKSGQASLRFDDAPARFRSGKEEDHFSGASGVLFEQAMAQTRMAICLVDPHEEDLPIVFANRAFRRLTGYSEEEIVGNNCRFLQGPKTDPQAVGRLRDAIKNEDVVVVEKSAYLQVNVSTCKTSVITSNCLVTTISRFASTYLHGGQGGTCF